MVFEKRPFQLKKFQLNLNQHLTSPWNNSKPPCKEPLAGISCTDEEGTYMPAAARRWTPGPVRTRQRPGTCTCPRRCLWRRTAPASHCQTRAPCNKIANATLPIQRLLCGPSTRRELNLSGEFRETAQKQDEMRPWETASCYGFLCKRRNYRHSREAKKLRCHSFCAVP